MITQKDLLEVRDSIANLTIQGIRKFGMIEPAAFLLLEENDKIRPIVIPMEASRSFDYIREQARELGALAYVLTAEGIRVNNKTGDKEKVITVNFETKLITELLTYKTNIVEDEGMPAIPEVSNIERGNFSGVLYSFNNN